MTLILLLLFSTLAFTYSEQELFNYYDNKPKSYQPRTRHLENGKAQFVNHLILSNSPYLLQHAHNPVNWHEFGDKAFNLAKSQNKLIFLSIGYATCHWCHVMEEESFEDLAVAKVLNDNFIAIKVDREVLPDVDSHFMDISMITNKRGGWPLNVVLTPDGDGFFAGTYFRKNNLINRLQNLNNIWTNDRQKILTVAKNIKNLLIKQNDIAKKLPKNLQNIATNELLARFDEFYGGFTNAPKFPREPQLLMLLDEQKRNPNKETLTAITTTLDNMAIGGLYDVVAGGFHRYATDHAWAFPHFEKMLYNQAQLAMVYTKAYQITNKYLYKRVATQTLDYVLREMHNNGGGFYSATDADSEQKEGAFFIWDKAEIKQILGDEFTLFTKYFDLSGFTSFEDKHVIRYQDITLLSVDDFKKIQPLLDKLYQARQQREKPLLDNKILLSWNALMLKAFIMASEIDAKYLQKAQDLAQFLITNFYQNTLQRVQIEGVNSQEGIFEDYSYFTDSLIMLFDITSDKKYLHLVQKLIDEAIRQFWDVKDFGFRISNNKYINNNNKEIYDGAIFGSNGVAYSVLNKLYNRTMDDKYNTFAANLLKSFSAKIIQQPSSYPTIVKAHTVKKHGTLLNKVYLYGGKVAVSRSSGKVLIKISKGWHINAHNITTKGIIPTVLRGDIDNVFYPQGEMITLGFSEEELEVYTNVVEISFKDNGDNAKQHLELTIQACSDKVCLPPQTTHLGTTLF